MVILVAGGGTGGHLMPALAIAAELVRQRADVEPVMIGAQRGIESTVLPRYPFRFHLLAAEPIYRRQWWKNVRWPLVAWRVLRQIRALLERERPALVIGTGGYASGPVLWRAQRRGLPTVLQEQNALPGMTTRWLAPGARQIHLGFPEARARLRAGPRTDIFSLGNPVRPPDAGDAAAARRELGLPPDRPTILVTGGSQGAMAINRVVADAVRAGGFEGLNLIWSTGAAHAGRFDALAGAGVVIRGFLDPIATAYRAADVVVCRAGAMTIAELCAWGKASVLIPLPTAAADHQSINARALEDAGAAITIAERALTAPGLTDLVWGLVRDRDRLASLADAARRRGHPDATRAMVSKILTLLAPPQALSQV
jgi:UDP-N-acetylglucosamine--N-acetylmuramyl-(pentapeptide) pyrophosphoryl-undecaprenol N-acetylglucosamine transferase